MRFLLVSAFFLFALGYYLDGQTKTELEEKRKKTLAEINYVDNLLQTTAKEKTEGINSVKIIGRKLDLRESVIRSMREEINLISDRIELNNLAIDMMEDDLVTLRNDYAKAVVNSYKSQKCNPELIYVLSAKDFNQGYKRL